MKSRLVSAIAALALFAAPLPALAAEVYAILASTQEIQGLVQAGEDIRLEFPIAAGAEPRLTLTLGGAKPGQPISISEFHLIGPDGVEIFLPPNAFFTTKFSNTSVTLTFSGWIATQSGNHQIFLRTNSRVLARAKGKLTVKRVTKIPLAGDETAPQIKIALQPGDTSSVALKLVSGTAPKVIQYRIPSGTQVMPGQQVSKTGTKTNALLATQFGEYTYTVGYQDAAAPAGAWKGTLKLKPFKGGSPATLRLRNSPGVPLSVRDADRFFLPQAGGALPVGVATDGNNVVVTTEPSGVLTAQVFDRELVASTLFPAPIALTSSLDFTPGETLLGHRVLFQGGFYFALLSTASATELELLRIRTDFVRDGFGQVLSASPNPTSDFFFGASPTKLAIGVFAPPNGHTVYLVNPLDFASRTIVASGGTLRPQHQGSGIAWRPDDSVFELWTPDTLDYHGPSDLHRVLYDSSFAPTTPDLKPVNDPNAVETMPTGVTVDAQTGVTILHYVVADNPPAAGFPGFGKIHRRLFDATGVEIPGSRAILPRSTCSDPVAVIQGSLMFVAYESSAGPVVERYPLLR